MKVKPKGRAGTLDLLAHAGGAQARGLDNSRRLLPMKTACHLSLVVLAGLVLPAAAQSPKEVRVQFEPGTTEASLRGAITGRESILYRLNAREGQFLSVRFSSSSTSADFNLYIPGRGPGDEALFASAMAPKREYLVQLYKTGDHTVSVFLNRNAARRGDTAEYEIRFTLTDTLPAPVATPAPATGTEGALSQEVSYDGLRFRVTSPGLETGNNFTLTPSGLTATNREETYPIEGQAVRVLCDDIDGDNSPELAVLTQAGPQRFGRAYLFSCNARKSLSQVHFRDVAEDPALLKGYAGYDEYEFVENTFIRRFPLFSDGEKTGKSRQFQFKLKPGEAMKQLVLDRTVEY